MLTPLDQALEKRRITGLLRDLRVREGMVDFCSNDYLGLASDEEFLLSYKDQVRELSKIGSTGSRLISGNSAFIEGLENEIASFLKAPSGLIFNTGYLANLGLFSAISGRESIILYDEKCHASIRDGLRLGTGRHYRFAHNDLSGLYEQLKKYKGDIWVAVESVYSMDGDLAPLKELAELCSSFGARLIVDEAHATGVMGNNGEGLVVESGLEEHVAIRVHTFGKALGCHGSIVLCDPPVRNYLINFSRPFIYTTAPSGTDLLAVEIAFEILKKDQFRRTNLKANIRYFNSMLPQYATPSPIKSIPVPGNERARFFSDELARANIDVRAILNPTVAEGTERLRICLHSFNNEKEILSLVEALPKSF